MTLQNITFSYGDKPVLREVSLTLPARGTVCLCGDSGCGKTTLLRLLCGLETPQAGECIDLPRRPAVVFQENRLLPWKTALDNVTLVLGDRSDAADRAAAALRAVGLDNAPQTRLPSELSGGQCRRVALARALALPDADALLLDEPFTGLDDDCIGAVAALIRQAAQTIPVLVITHNEQDAAHLNATLLRMKNGKIE